MKTAYKSSMSKCERRAKCFSWHSQSDDLALIMNSLLNELFSSDDMDFDLMVQRFLQGKLTQRFLAIQVRPTIDRTRIATTRLVLLFFAFAIFELTSVCCAQED